MPVVIPSAFDQLKTKLQHDMDRAKEVMAEYAAKIPEDPARHLENADGYITLAARMAQWQRLISGMERIEREGTDKIEWIAGCAQQFQDSVNSLAGESGRSTSPISNYFRDERRVAFAEMRETLFSLLTTMRAEPQPVAEAPASQVE